MVMNLLMAITLNTEYENINSGISLFNLGWTEIIGIAVGILCIGIVIGIVCGGKMVRSSLQYDIATYQEQIAEYEQINKQNDKTKKLYRNLSRNLKYKDYPIYVNGVQVKHLPNIEDIRAFTVDDVNHNIYIDCFAYCDEIERGEECTTETKETV